jgi:hypothetical protein
MCDGNSCRRAGDPHHDSSGVVSKRHARDPSWTLADVVGFESLRWAPVHQSCKAVVAARRRGAAARGQQLARRERHWPGRPTRVGSRRPLVRMRSRRRGRRRWCRDRRRGAAGSVGVLKRELCIDRGNRYFLAVLSQQALAELIDGVQTARGSRDRAEQPGADAEEDSGAHARRLTQIWLRDRKDFLNARDHLRHAKLCQ